MREESARRNASSAGEELLVGLRTSRIEALCDGVFAIAMTILVLNISVPNAPATSLDRLPGALLRLIPALIVYAITFINLGVLWVGQHNQYHFIRRTDRWFIWINIAFLMTISFMPLTTAVLGQYPTSAVALRLYGANIILATLILCGHWIYATTEKRLVDPDMPDAVTRLARRRMVYSVAAYLIAAAIAAQSPMLSLLIFFAFPLINVLPFRFHRLFRRQRSESHIASIFPPTN